MPCVLLVSDAGFHAELVGRALEQGNRIEIHFTRDTPAAIRALKDAAFDLVLVDTTMADSAGVVRALSACGTGTSIAALGARADDALAWAGSGASGYISRDETLDRLPERVQSLIRGELECPSSVVAELFKKVAALGVRDDFDPADVLSPREREVAQLIALELSNKEIGVRLSISETTVKCHVHSCCKKTAVKNRHQLGRWWRSRV